MKERLAEALKLMNPRGVKENCSIEELITNLRVFGSSGAGIILDHLYEDEVERLIDKTVDIILEYATKAPTEQLVLPKIINKMFEEARKTYPEICEKIDDWRRQERFSYKIKEEVRDIERRITKPISAVTPKELIEKAKKEAEEAFDYSLVEKSILENVSDAGLIAEVKQEFIDAKKRALSYIEIMEKKPPVKLYYYRTGNGGVACKINLNSRSYSYRSGTGRSVKSNNGNDREDYPLIVSINNLLNFLYQNGILYKDILIDPRSIEVFYMFSNHVSQNLTPAFVEKWWNYDCPDLYRCTVNKNGQGYNMLGERLPHFTTKLVESSYYGVYVDKNITEDEACLITANRMHTEIAQEIESVLKSKNMTLDELKDRLADVQTYEQKIQKVIDDNKEEILEFLKERFNDRIISEDPLRIEDMFGLDCGYIHVFTTDSKYNEDARLIKNSPLSSEIRLGLNVHFPYGSQSLTLMRAQFGKIKEVVKREVGETLYCKSIMD